MLAIQSLRARLAHLQGRADTVHSRLAEHTQALRELATTQPAAPPLPSTSSRPPSPPNNLTSNLSETAPPAPPPGSAAPPPPAAAAAPPHAPTSKAPPPPIRTVSEELLCISSSDDDEPQHLELGDLLAAQTQPRPPQGHPPMIHIDYSWNTYADDSLSAAVMQQDEAELARLRELAKLPFTPLSEKWSSVPYDRGQCAHDGCEVELPRDMLEEHEKETCWWRLVDCPSGCGVRMRYEEVMRHVSHECERAVLVCSRCGQDVHRGMFHWHAKMHSMEKDLVPAPRTWKEAGLVVLEKDVVEVPKQEQPEPEPEPQAAVDIGDGWGSAWGEFDELDELGGDGDEDDDDEDDEQKESEEDESNQSEIPSISAESGLAGCRVQAQDVFDEHAATRTALSEQLASGMCSQAQSDSHAYEQCQWLPAPQSSPYMDHGLDLSHDVVLPAVCPRCRRRLNLAAAHECGSLDPQGESEMHQRQVQLNILEALQSEALYSALRGHTRPHTYFRAQAPGVDINSDATTRAVELIRLGADSRRPPHVQLAEPVIAAINERRDTIYSTTAQLTCGDVASIISAYLTLKLEQSVETVPPPQQLSMPAYYGQVAAHFAYGDQYNQDAHW